MERQDLDFILVPSGLVILVAYHTWLLYRIVKHPTKTVIGINSINRAIWVETMMEDTGKNGVLAVQTFRNNIMASTLLASTAIALSSLIAGRITSYPREEGRGEDLSSVRAYWFVYGNTSELGFSIKCFSILVCFLLAFLMNVQSIRYYSHASILINVPMRRISPCLTEKYVGKTVNRGSYFWSLGLRAFYFSFPLFLWVFGPIPMFLSCFILVFLLFFLDVSFDWRRGGEASERGQGEAAV